MFRPASDQRLVIDCGKALAAGDLLPWNQVGFRYHYDEFEGYAYTYPHQNGQILFAAFLSLLAGEQAAFFVAAAQRGLPGSRYFVYRKNGRRGSGDEKRVLRPGTSNDGISSIFLLRHLRLWDAAWVCLFRCGCMVREKIFGGAEKAGSDSFVCPDLCGYSVQI